MQEDLMNLNNIEKHNQKLQARSAEHEHYNKQLIKFHIQQAETHKCYNCDKSEHLVRDCKKSQWQRKEVAMMNSVIMHDQLSWTACYNNDCFVHISSKDRAEWWLQKLKKRHSTDYITMSESKKLAILEKVVRNNSDKIKKTDTCRTQKIDTAEA